MQSTVNRLKEKAKNIRKDLLKLCSIESIHIGGDLSSVDLMTVLWQYQIKYNPRNPKDNNRDRFVLSKSHASAVLSFNQAELGCFDKNIVFNTYAKDESMFSMHSCSLVNPFVEVSTGSLGHGLPIACGMAQGLKLKNNNKSKVYVFMGDGEQAEGSIWEAVMYAAHLKLNNIIAIIDNNNMGADGDLKKYSCVKNLDKKYEAFGWEVYKINGNSIKQIVDIFNRINNKRQTKPIVIIGKTVKGKGISFMENNPKWHAGKLTDLEYKNALGEINNEK